MSSTEPKTSNQTVVGENLEILPVQMRKTINAIFRLKFCVSSVNEDKPKSNAILGKFTKHQTVKSPLHLVPVGFSEDSPARYLAKRSIEVSRERRHLLVFGKNLFCRVLQFDECQVPLCGALCQVS